MKYQTGQCFKETYEFVSKNHEEWIIVHGICINRKTKLKMIHAWAKHKFLPVVRDIDSDGEEVFISLVLYEVAGKVSEITEYTFEEMTEIILNNSKDKGYSVYGCYIEKYCIIENESRKKLGIELEDYSYLGLKNE